MPQTQVQVVSRNADGDPITNFSFQGSNPFLHEGYIMENDFIAYRAILNAPFGFDVIGKNTANLLLDTVQRPLTLESRWGGDILSEGLSLGIGGPALFDMSDIVHFSTFDERTYEVIAEGPLRAEIHIRILGIPVRDEKVDILVKWQMQAGHHWAQIDMELITPTDLTLQMARELGSRLGATVMVFHSLVPPYFSYDDPSVDLGAVPTFGFEGFKTAEKEHVNKMVADFDWRGVEVQTTFLDGNPAQGILDRQEFVDLIVMGTHGRTGLARAFLGSQAYNVIKEARVPVLAVPNPERQYPESEK